MRFFFVSLLFAVSFLYAEIVQSVKIYNITYMSESLAKDIINIKVGDKLDGQKIDEAILALYQQGYFSDLYATFENGILSFYATEKPAVASIEIKGYGSQSEKDTLYGQLGIKKGDTYDDIKLEKALEVLKQMLEYKGYYGSVIEPEVKELSEGRAVAITLNVNRGDSIIIEKSYYEGASQLKKRKIESLSANKQADFMGWLPGLNNGKLMLSELELDPLRIQDSYMRNGFLDANVSHPLLSVNMTNHKAQLYYNIKEGNQYKVKDIEFIIDEEHKGLISDEELRKNLTTKIDMVVNVQNLRDDSQVIKLKVADLGYAYVAVNPDLKKDTEKKEVTIIYYIDFGKKVHINDIVITGNTRTGDRIIRREVLIAPGETYSLGKIQSSEIALKRIGYFENVHIDEKRISDDSMDLVVNVTEGRTGELNFGIGYGSFYGLMVNASINERNLFGSGFGASLYANVSFGGDFSYYRGGASNFFAPTQQAFNLSLTNPRVLDSKWSLSLNIYYSRYLNYVYTQQSIGGGFTVGRLLLPTLRLNIGYDINKTDTFGFYNLYTGQAQPQYQKYYDSGNIDYTVNNPNYDSKNPPGSTQDCTTNTTQCSSSNTTDKFFKYRTQGLWDRSYSGWNNAPIKSSISPSLVFDNTDDYYFPKNGNSTTLSLNIAGIGGDVYYTKLYAKTGFYVDLQKYTKLDFIFRYKAQGGYLFRYNQNHFLPLNDTFYMGGVGTIRGYSSYSITPLDSDRLRVGGDGIFTNSIELSYGLIPSAKMRVSLYADYGILTYHGANNNANFKQYGTLGGQSSILQRGAAGIAIEWVSPMGPIVIVFPMLWYGPTDPEGLGPPQFFSYGTANKIRASGGYLTNYPSFFEFTMGTRF
ncbi:outer membrane protein assembly factor BamA [Helicobacter didelphidarum]|uniref:Outer membrane protein assembly factor BamA n=1 Tax=Helicobacter didelphidarum TaxID=2040648 RepID=A0A3D8IM17_9HELI|nr:outer membrane protein assembly factor BamA [Helicobacter didelphidarum]RDU66222.1 outer membrane protein assembly factor BamA [Helicobacter didelphidarum]